MPDENANNKAAAESVETSRKAAIKSRDEQLKEEHKASEDATKEQLDRVANLRPTPTQEENDRAKLGLHSVEELDDKEGDGSPEEREASAGKGTAGALNRSVSTK